MMNVSSRFVPAAVYALSAAGLLQIPGLAHASPSHMWRANLEGAPGWVETRYGMSDVNRCLADTTGFDTERNLAVTGLGLAPSYRRVEVTGKECLNIRPIAAQNHLEGVARIAVPGREFLYFSYQDEGPGSDAYKIVRVDIKPEQTLTSEEFLLSEEEPGDAAVMFCKDLPNATHVGGMQAVGDYLFVAVTQGPTGRVDIYKVKDGNVMRDQGALGVPTTVAMPPNQNALYVMATRLVDGKYFMAVNSGNGGRFNTFWADHPEGPWAFVREHVFPEIGDWSGQGVRYQSANFLTDCSGKLYIIALGQRPGGFNGENGWDEDNEVFMYSVALRRDAYNRPSIEWLNGVGMFDHAHHTELCQMRGAGGAHVTKSGRLSLYCGPQHGKADHSFDFSSIRPLGAQ